METYSVTLERGADGTYLGWVDELPGCALRGSTRAELLERLPGEIAGFRAWAGEPEAAPPRITVTEEVDSTIEADEDTEVLVSYDRLPFTPDDLERTRRWLGSSRDELFGLLHRLSDEQLEETRTGTGRTVREELEHVGFVELMYAMWTFDLRSRTGLADFLGWTRAVATERLGHLSRRRDADLTWADWAGAPSPEPWTARKTARRLLWHELLHLRAIERFAEPRDAS